MYRIWVRALAFRDLQAVLFFRFFLPFQISPIRLVEKGNNYG
mgnify:CR=1 FL=1